MSAASPGRPSFAPTEAHRRTVRAMAAYGVPQAEIAAVLDVAMPTLRKHFRLELDTAAAEANAKVAESLFRRATGDGPQSVTAAIFWLKCRAGWQEVEPREGKKEKAAKAAHTAGLGTHWGNLLQVPKGPHERT